MNYRTLSDSAWVVSDESGNIWNGNKLGEIRRLSDKIRFRLYGPEFFTSFNSASPYGQNDGALWQGKGFNTSLTGGFRFEACGFELTFKPQLVFSQNLAFDILEQSVYDSEYGYIWGCAENAGVDAPQRFGDDALFGYSWGDSEIRYTWKYLTFGIGTQSPWLGPGRVNAILHSNNASPYPKADFGLRRMPVKLFGWYAGDIETRLWSGYLSESDYFDDDDSNDHNLISGLSLAYGPSFLPGLTLFVNRTYLAKWEADSFKTIPSLFFINLEGGGSQDDWDQRASFGFDYLLPSAGIELYGEAGINDYGPSLDGYIRYPFHSMVYTGGLRKSVTISFLKQTRGELSFEWTNLEMSQDFQFQWPTSFYMHHQITQGYTNEGQWLAAGIGTGGNNQYLGFKLYYPKGSTNIYINRTNPDNDYLYRLTILTTDNEESIQDFKTVLSFCLQTEYFLNSSILLSGGLGYIIEHNPLYNSVDWFTTNKRRGFRIEVGARWML